MGNVKFFCKIILLILIYIQSVTVSTKIITFFTAPYADIFKNFYRNLKKYSVEKNLHVFITEGYNLEFLKNENISFSVISNENLLTEKSETYGTYNWNKINLVKGTIFNELLYKYDDFIYSDPDVIWFGSIYQKLKKECKKDLCVQSDSIKDDTELGSLNAGFFYVKSTIFTRSLFSEWRLRCLNNDGIKDDDQTILNKIVKEKNLKENIQRLDRSIFANGKYNGYFDKCIKNSRLLTLHNNWVRGKDTKVSRAKKCGYWFE